MKMRTLLEKLISVGVPSFTEVHSRHQNRDFMYSSMDKVVDKKLSNLVALHRNVVLFCSENPNPGSYQVGEMVAMWMIINTGKRGTLEGYKLLNWLVDNGKQPAALYNLAMAKLIGQVCPWDAVDANRLFHTILNLESRSGQVRGLALSCLADSYRTGRGVQADLAHAVEYYIESASMGIADAAYNAAMYFQGRIGGPGAHTAPVNIERAAEFYRMAMDAGKVEAQTNLGVLHMGRQLKASDATYGRELLQKSAAQGDAAAQEAVELFEDVQNPTQTLTNTMAGLMPSGKSLFNEEKVEQGGLTMERDAKALLDAVYADWQEEREANLDAAQGGQEAVQKQVGRMQAYPGGIDAYTAESFARRSLITLGLDERQHGISDRAFTVYLDLLRTSKGRKRLLDVYAENAGVQAMFD